MSMDAARSWVGASDFEQIRYARDVVLAESQALARLAGRIDLRMTEAVDLLAGCADSVVVSGMGKAGLIGQKISATLASTGTRSFFLHPAEAVHGDLGRLGADDCLLILSQSGETDEVVRLLPSLRRLGLPIVAITARQQSTLGQAAQVVLELGTVTEACPLGLAPTTSTTLMLALGDALALVASRRRAFGRADFARVHPAGHLGRQLSTVDDHMRPIEQCRVAPATHTVREIFAALRRPGRRTGAVMLVDASGRLVGLFTDSDLARLFEARRDAAFDQSVEAVMTCAPITVCVGSPLASAVAILAERKISELPVVDADGVPRGLLDITDVLSLLPDDALEATMSVGPQ